jgi:hypothetical protein
VKRGIAQDVGHRVRRRGKFVLDVKLHPGKSAGVAPPVPPPAAR